jgi:hypothetical protein
VTCVPKSAMAGVIGKVPYREMIVEDWNQVTDSVVSYAVSVKVGNTDLEEPVYVIPIPGETGLLGRDLVNLWHVHLYGPGSGWRIVSST